MPTNIEMPKLSDTMTVGTVVKWHKQVGDKVVNGDTLAEIETDKATMELENFDDGTLLKILVEEGAEAPIGSPLAVVGEEGESVEEDSMSVSEDSQDEESSLASPLENKVETTVEDNTPEEVNTEVEFSSSTGEPELLQNEPNIESDLPPQKQEVENLAPKNRTLISPLAKKMASDRNLDISKLKGTGPSGRIVKKDILEADYSDEEPSDPIDKMVSAVALEQPVPKSSGLLAEKSVPLSGMRTVIAKRLTESKTTIPHFYLQKEINAEPLLEARIAINENSKLQSEQSDFPYNKVSVNDLILKASAEAIKWHPDINTSWGEEKITHHGVVNLAFGVAIEGGLLTPVINHAEQLSLLEISLEAKSLIQKARDKKLLPEAMSGSTFTVTNLGMFGIDFFSGIINPPNAAILSVGSSINKPVVDKNGDIVSGKTITLGLSCDHRLVDGAIGASFLKTLGNYLENPVCMFG